MKFKIALLIFFFTGTAAMRPLAAQQRVNGSLANMDLTPANRRTRYSVARRCVASSPLAGNYTEVLYTAYRQTPGHHVWYQRINIRVQVRP
jgi:hypothetical protein